MQAAVLSPNQCSCCSVRGAARRRFQCNVCGMLTDVPMDYYCATDANGVRHDLQQHPELTSGSVEYLAPTEYMVRARARSGAPAASGTAPPLSMHGYSQRLHCKVSGGCPYAESTVHSRIASLPAWSNTRSSLRMQTL